MHNKRENDDDNDSDDGENLSELGMLIAAAYLILVRSFIHSI